ncbi:peptide chain release factor 1, mitochondrial-like [Salvelinus fontinalis]|uniref:peptide chain release factor 1, mitochondrial-like n=1 Tax=Salvelinus fontinalis TaxID=8038 RepID=UPI0024866F45|nr:peptide chain release factor 1, mitochondrial-like [Salvelinus fontinalis]
MLMQKYSRLCGSCAPLISPLHMRKRIWKELANRSLVSSRRYCNNPLGDLYRNESVQRYLRQLVEEYRDVNKTLQHGFLNEPARKELNKRQVGLSPVATAFQSAEHAVKDLEEVETLLQRTVGSKEEDRQMVQLLKEEQAQITQRIESLRKDLIQTLVPSDPHDTSNVLLEVVTGRTTGGDICQQFTREMFDMYQGLASYKNWDFEIFNYTPAEYGGLHHAAVRIAGESVYRRLKHEGGTHRVQRIPEVGLSSRMQRIHTGTMTVIVLPQPNELDISIDPKDLRVDTFRSRGAGGQSVNTTDSAVRIVHLPTGTVAECQTSRSQLQNRDTALRVLRARLYQSMMGRETEQRLTARKQQVGTRSQSERIRTYNFSQDRVTDHRTGYVTRDIKEFMRGGEPLDDLISELLEHGDKEALLELVVTCSQRY